MMSKAEILAELPKLSPLDRIEILERLCRIEEEAGPSIRERTILGEAQSAYNADSIPGDPWSEVHNRLRKRP